MDGDAAGRLAIELQGPGLTPSFCRWDGLCFVSQGCPSGPPISNDVCLEVLQVCCRCCSCCIVVRRCIAASALAGCAGMQQHTKLGAGLLQERNKARRDAGLGPDCYFHNTFFVNKLFT